ncbi:MAG: helix-turn-helix transcriptional regulator [Flavobacteriales bacterium]
MSYRSKLRRSLLILERLARPASFAELEEHLADHGFALSPRTLQRDIEEMRHEFDIEVDYDRGANAYRIADRGDRHALLGLLERYQLVDLLSTAGSGRRDLRGCVQFEELGRLAGLHHLPLLLRAVRERRVTRITHARFQQEAKTYVFRPHLLKEYRGRWYVLGRSDKHKRPVALGVDRIITVKPTRERFARKSDVDDFYAAVIGVDASPGAAERIVLRFSAEQAPYIKSLPMHPSQQVLKEDRDGCVITLHVMPNLELRQLIMGWGEHVQVLEPKHLAKTIRQAHKAAAGRYR